MLVKVHNHKTGLTPNIAAENLSRSARETLDYLLKRGSGFEGGKIGVISVIWNEMIVKEMYASFYRMKWWNATLAGLKYSACSLPITGHQKIYYCPGEFWNER